MAFFCFNYLKKEVNVMDRTTLSQVVRAVRNKHGHRNVRLLKHIRVINGQAVQVIVKLENSIQHFPNGKSFFLWNNGMGSTRMEPIIL